MDFSSETESLMKPFIKSFGKCNKAQLSKEDHKSFQTILNTLYQDLYTNNDMVLNAGCFKHKVLTLTKRPHDFTSTYFPIPIQNYIEEHELYQLHFSCGNVGGREINVYFTLFAEEELMKIDYYVEQVRKMYVWLAICALWADKHCTKTLDIYIYPTPFKKNLPTSATTILGPEHVNTAYTFACAPHGQMVVFRLEEWFKVFIHETFHAYGLDFANSDSSNTNEFKKKIAALYPINSEFDLYEAYTETWARIINCVFSSFYALSNKRDKKAFIENVTVCIELERMFSLYQCIKVLSFMGLHYRDLPSKSLQGKEKHKETKHNTLSLAMYKENTHVFAYYVMTAIFLNDYEGFLLWCRKNNSSLLKFNNTPAGFESFFSYIHGIHNCEPLQHSIEEMGRLLEQNNKSSKNEELKNSTRMSIV